MMKKSVMTIPGIQSRGVCGVSGIDLRAMAGCVVGIGTVAHEIQVALRYLESWSIKTRFEGVTHVLFIMACSRARLGLAFVIASAGLMSPGVV